jgi:hypothetical protein
MGCVHTHWGNLAIEECGNPSHDWNVVEKNGEDNWKVGKIDQAIGQAPTPGLEHDKIGHDGPHVSICKTCQRGYDGANASKWNLEDEQFVVYWVILKDKNTFVLEVVEDHC